MQPGQKEYQTHLGKIKQANIQTQDRNIPRYRYFPQKLCTLTLDHLQVGTHIMQDVEWPRRVHKYPNFYLCHPL